MITKASENNSNEIMDIWLSANLSAHPFIPKTYWENLYDAVKAALPTADIFIYQENDEIKGFIGTVASSYIAGLFVNKDFQSQGIGSKLLTHCQKLYPRLELDVFVENESATAFYQKNGFTIIETKPNKDFGRDEHRMSWQTDKEEL